jgi:hypothetical protein
MATLAPLLPPPVNDPLYGTPPPEKRFDRIFDSELVRRFRKRTQMKRIGENLRNLRTKNLGDGLAKARNLIRIIKPTKIVKNFTNSACGDGGRPITFAHINKRLRFRLVRARLFAGCHRFLL